MTVSVVQSAFFPSNMDCSFTAPASAGNTVILVTFSYDTGSAVITASTPAIEGIPDVTATEIMTGQSPQPATVWFSAWMFPDLAADTLGPFSVVTANGTYSGVVGTAILEVAGLGPSPAVDQNPAPASGTGSTLATGTTGPVTGTDELILAAAVAYGQPLTAPASPWTDIQWGSGYILTACQAVHGAGGTYGLTIPAGGAANWAAGIITLGTAPPPPPSAAPGTVTVADTAAMTTAASDRPVMTTAAADRPAATVLAADWVP